MPIKENKSDKSYKRIKKTASLERKSLKLDFTKLFFCKKSYFTSLVSSDTLLGSTVVPLSIYILKRCLIVKLFLSTVESKNELLSSSVVVEAAAQGALRAAIGHRGAGTQHPIGRGRLSRHHRQDGHTYNCQVPEVRLIVCLLFLSCFHFCVVTHL